MKPFDSVGKDMELRKLFNTPVCFLFHDLPALVVEKITPMPFILSVPTIYPTESEVKHKELKIILLSTPFDCHVFPPLTVINIVPESPAAQPSLADTKNTDESL